MSTSDDLQTTAIVPGQIPQPPRDSLQRGFLFRISLAQFGLALSTIAPSIVGLPLRIYELDPSNKAVSLSLVMGVGAVVGLLSQPLAGRLSDRTTLRLGRRRPWLLAGSVTALVGLVIVAFAPSIAVVLLGWCITMAGYNMAQAALYATTFDQVPASHRSRVTGALGAALTLSMLVGVAVLSQIGNTRLQLLIPPAVGALLVGYFAAAMEDRPRVASHHRLSLTEFRDTYWTDVSKYPDFGWVWLSRALVMIGIMAPPSYLAFYLMSRLQLSSADAPAMIGVMTGIYFLSIMVAVTTSGFLSDKYERRKPFVIGSALAVGAGLLLLAVAPTLGLIALAQVVIGIGGGMFYAVDLALVTDVMPDADAVGKDFGVMNLAIAVPQTLAPALAAATLIGDGDNYVVFFGLLGVFSLGGALAVTRIRGIR